MAAPSHITKMAFTLAACAAVGAYQAANPEPTLIAAPAAFVTDETPVRFNPKFIRSGLYIIPRQDWAVETYNI